jgi:homoserine dehydrogenase
MIQTPIILLGVGNVGRALLRQALDTRAALTRRAGLRLLITSLADSQALLHDPDGLSDDVLRNTLRAKTAARSLSTLPQAQPLNGLSDTLRPDSILVDLTASPDTASTLKTALQAGSGIVLANKHLLGGPWSEAQAFLDYAHLRYEVTVGAGLPVIATLRTLLRTGDQVSAIEGCFSGTLGYLCTQLENGVSYSEAVSQAKNLGYTEPDPRQDLGGLDVARKALILARTVGWPLEMNDLDVEPLFTETLSDISVREFMAATPILNGPYARRVQSARKRGQALRYVARVGPQGGLVGLEAVPHDSLLGALHGPANFIALHTARYDQEPLIISGPGAGPEVTAAGVLGDIINLALQRMR